jgi:hypothetical protein
MAEVAVPKELFQEILRLIDTAAKTGPREQLEGRIRDHDRRSVPGCQGKWPERGIRRRSGPLERRKHCAAHLWLAGNPAVCYVYAVAEFIWEISDNLVTPARGVYAMGTASRDWCRDRSLSPEPGGLRPTPVGAVSYTDSPIDWSNRRRPSQHREATRR